jgi:hypothetical protein
LVRTYVSDKDDASAYSNRRFRDLELEDGGGGGVIVVDRSRKKDAVGVLAAEALAKEEAIAKVSR